MNIIKFVIMVVLCVIFGATAFLPPEAGSWAKGSMFGLALSFALWPIK